MDNEKFDEFEEDFLPFSPIEDKQSVEDVKKEGEDKNITLENENNQEKFLVEEDQSIFDDTFQKTQLTSNNSDENLKKLSSQEKIVNDVLSNDSYKTGFDDAKISKLPENQQEDKNLENILGKENIVVNKDSLLQEEKSIFDDNFQKTQLQLNNSDENLKNLSSQENVIGNDQSQESSKEVSDDAKASNLKEKQSDTIKKAKKVIYKNSRIIPVFAFLFISVLGVYIFINNVNADQINLIKIEENSKVGYIDDEGEVIVRPKYLYGSDYYKGYAVVKNYNSLYGILDGEGKNEIAFGNIFSANLYGNRYIVSKFTNEGLKMGLLDANLKEITRFKYDNLAYSKSGVFMFTEDEKMGILNKDGKEIYTYKVDEVDDRNISIEVSNLSGDSNSDLYAKIKINDSSTIINTKTGKEVYKYTLDEIYVLDNNVFYIKNNSKNNKYFVIKNDKIVYETSEYRRIRVEDLNSDIAIAIKEDSKIDYIDLLSREKINSNDNTKYTYSNGVIVEESFNFSLKKNEFIIKKPSKTLGNISDINPTDNIFVNGYMKIKTSNEKYNYVNKKGNIISKKEYETASDFNENGYAIVSNDGNYGIIDKNGKEVISTKYEEIIMLDTDLFNSVKKNNKEELFIFKSNGKYGIINSDEKVVIKAIYDSFKEITTKYPVIEAKYNKEKVIINLSALKELTITANDDIEVYDNYIISNNEYYNYNGNLIYSIGG